MNYYDPYPKEQLRFERTDRTGRLVRLGDGYEEAPNFPAAIAGILAAVLIVALLFV